MILTVDIVLLTLRQARLHVGLLRRAVAGEPYHGVPALPGGFVHVQHDRTAQDTARRVLRDKVGVVDVYLEQLATFSGQARDPRGWSASIAYYALTAPHILPAESEGFQWVAVEQAMADKLPFDHNDILRTAVERVRSKTRYSTLPLHLMPDEFTLSELRQVYEQVLGGRLEPRGFSRRMQEMGLLEETGVSRIEAHRPARMYRIKPHMGGLACMDAALAVRSLPVL